MRRYPVRVYAPVGTHEDLLAYLVRRLLENGANTSFVHRLVDPSVPEEAIVADPVARLRALGVSRNPRIPLPRDLYPDRVNSAGVDLADRATAPALLAAIRRQPTAARHRRAHGEIRSPADRRVLVGAIDDAGPSRDRCASSTVLARGWRDWDTAGRRPPRRGAGARRRSDRGVARRNCCSCWRAKAARRWPTASRRFARPRTTAAGMRCMRASDFAAPRELPGPTGERNTWALGGRGVFAAISPWNFPLAIFTGQVAAALAAGNAVAAKPAEQTPLVAARAVALLLEAGVPRVGAGTAAGRRHGRAGAGERPAHRGRRLHRRHRDRAGDRAVARRAARADRSVHRRDRRHQRDDRGQFSAARAGGDRRARPARSVRPASAARRCGCCACRTTSPTACCACCAARRRRW